LRSEPARKGLAQTMSFPPAQSLAESHRIRGSSAYAAPSVDDYGSLVDLTLNSEILGPGIGVPRMLFAQISSPVVPGDPGGGGDGDGDRNGNGDGNGNGNGNGSDGAGDGGGTLPGGPITGPPAPAEVPTPGEGDVAGGETSGGSGGGVGGASGAGTTGAGAGGGGGDLPFTGYPAALAALVGSGLSAAGIAVRRATRGR